MSKSRGNNLVALGSAAVLIIYTAGFAKTKPAADRMAAESAERGPRSASRAGAGAAGARTAAGESGAATVPAMTASSVTAVPTGVAGLKPAASTTTPAMAATVVKSPTVTPTAASYRATVDAARPPTVTPTTTASVTASVTAPVSAPVSTPPIAAPAVSAPPVVTSPVAPSSAPAKAEPAPNAPVPAAPAPVSTPTPEPAPAAPAVAPAVAPAAKPAGKTSYKDGVYLGRGTSRHGDIEAMVEIRDGRITNTVISQCLTRYSCSWIAVLVPQVVARQSAEVDYVSGATVSSDAFYYAVTQALAQAK